MGTVEIANSFAMNRSTVSRMLRVLKRQGFVRQNPENKKYALGPKINSLALAYRSSFISTVTEVARPVLDALRLTLDQTVVLETPATDHAMVAYVSEGLGPIRISARVGDRHAYHSAAGGKCLLAFSAEDRLQTVLSRDLPRLTANTITEPTEIQRELEKIRTAGFAFDNEENNEGICAFAVPLVDAEGLPVAAIVAAGPSHGVTWEKRTVFLKELRWAAEKISRMLSGESADHF